MKTRQSTNTVRLLMQPAKKFSVQQRPPSGPSGGYGFLPLLGLGLGTAGIAMLMIKGRQMMHAKSLSQYAVGQPAQTLFSPQVQQRIRSTMLYFGTGLGATGVLVGALRNSAFAYMNPFILLFGSLGLLFGTMMTDFHSNPALKHTLWAGFIGTIALSMIPLINMASMPIIYDALFATGISMGALGAVAYNAPNEQFL